MRISQWWGWALTRDAASAAKGADAVSTAVTSNLAKYPG